MKLLLALCLCAPASAANMPDLDLLRAILVEQTAVELEQPPVPKVQAAPAVKDFEGIVKVEKKSPNFRRPKDALKDRSLTLAPRIWAWVKNDANGRALAPGTRAWVKGRFGEEKSGWAKESRVLEVLDSVSFPALTAQGLAPKAQNKELALELSEVSPWCDHMPGFGAPAKRQYLVVRTKLSNKTDKPVTVSLARAFFSFDAKSEGSPVSGLSIRSKNGLGSGDLSVTLEPKASADVSLRGDGLYPEGAHGKTLYVTLQLTVGASSLFVRGAGEIIATQ